MAYEHYQCGSTNVSLGHERDFKVSLASLGKAPNTWRKKGNKETFVLGRQIKWQFKEWLEMCKTERLVKWSLNSLGKHYSEFQKSMKTKGENSK